ncbi:hypothetical protein GH714_000485 [Hevea brasiliensis]|uniref:DUF4219 domain-containing protein n=1 Tax=Hevea brasiliensis TaxID=3981 RepID=A0A6A6L5D2_HEVBR|nr:hypothetical protein GH714_000485 [Hevea brasiliensis]
MLNHNNYSTWSIRMQYYLLGQDLWSIVKGSDTTPPIDDEEAKKWRIKATKAMSVSQANLTISQYFTKVKSICIDISKLDPENKIGDLRLRRIIIHGLRPEYVTPVTPTRGWAKKPTLTELDNLLANQEALNKQMSGVTIKDKEKTLFINNKKNFKEKFKNGEEEGNVAASTSNGSEVEWDLQTSIAVEKEADLCQLSESKEEVTLATPCNEVVNYKEDWIVDFGCSNHITGDTGKLSDMISIRDVEFGDY